MFGPRHRTKRGSPSTSAEALQPLITCAVSGICMRLLTDLARSGAVHACSRRYVAPTVWIRLNENGTSGGG
jgi:hypothetical protein